MGSIKYLTMQNNYKFYFVSHSLLKTSGLKMAVKIDLSGQQIGMFRVLGENGHDMEGRISWRVLCVCGKELSFSRPRLLRMKRKNCGCVSKSLKERSDARCVE